MGNSVVGTIADVATDKRTYYKCPRCGKEKWAYGTFAGTQCLDCTPSNPVGTAVDVVTHTADMVVDTTVGVATGGQVKITGAVSGSVGYLTDKATNGNKGQVSYNCPVCKKEVWAYGSYAGTTCKKCMSEGKVDESDYKSNGAAKLNKDAGHLFEAQKPSYVIINLMLTIFIFNIFLIFMCLHQSIVYKNPHVSNSDPLTSLLYCCIFCLRLFLI